MCVRGHPSVSASFWMGHLADVNAHSRRIKGDFRKLPRLGGTLRMCFFSRRHLWFYRLGPAWGEGAHSRTQHRPPGSLCHSCIKGSRCPSFSNKSKSTKTNWNHTGSSVLGQPQCEVKTGAGMGSFPYSGELCA